LPQAVFADTDSDSVLPLWAMYSIVVFAAEAQSV
jgi:hypothetical protein